MRQRSLGVGVLAAVLIWFRGWIKGWKKDLVAMGGRLEGYLLDVKKGKRLPPLTEQQVTRCRNVLPSGDGGSFW